VFSKYSWNDQFINYVVDAMTLSTEEEEKIGISSLPNELASLEESMERLLICLTKTSTYVNEMVSVKSKNQVLDPKIGREIADALASIPLIATEQFEQNFSSSLQDLLMVSYLSGLTQAQLSMAEKLINT
jgi:translation initiation factor 3 subunit F